MRISRPEQAVRGRTSLEPPAVGVPQCHRFIGEEGVHRDVDCLSTDFDVQPRRMLSVVEEAEGFVSTGYLNASASRYAPIVLRRMDNSKTESASKRCSRAARQA